VTVVPSDELGRGPRSGEVLAGKTQAAIGLRADGVDDGVVQAQEIRMREVAADLDVAEESEPRLGRDALERARNGLELGMVGRDAEPDETPGRREPLDHVDLDRHVGVEQSAGRIEPGGTGPNDRNPKRIHAGDASPDLRRPDDQRPEVRAGEAGLTGGRTHAGGDAAAPPPADHTSR
jgi:hypothetical protein